MDLGHRMGMSSKVFLNVRMNEDIVNSNNSKISAAIASVWHRMGIPVRIIWDIMPPYPIIQGVLEAKEVSPSGKHMILIKTDIVEVDGFTFEILKVGEALRARCTKSNRAIRIDRLIPTVGHKE